MNVNDVDARKVALIQADEAQDAGDWAGAACSYLWGSGLTAGRFAGCHICVEPGWMSVARQSPSGRQRIQWWKSGIGWYESGSGCAVPVEPHPETRAALDDAVDRVLHGKPLTP